VPKRPLTQVRAFRAKSGRLWTRLVTCSTISAPNSEKKTTRNRTTARRTRPVAAPRGMWRASRPTAGSMASEMNQAITAVKISDAPSLRTNRPTANRTISPITTSPIRQTLPGTRTTLVTPSRLTC